MPIPDLRLLTVHAHPDDEASKGAPTCAMYGAEGVRTVLVCCTGGEEGDLQNPALRAPGQPFHGLTPEGEREVLARVRPLELARSAEIIGFDRTVMLGYRDSGMPGTPANDDAASFHRAPLDEAVGRLVEVIRAERPQVVLTYGDDQQSYPHPDHLRVHEISVLAFERAGDPAWYAHAGDPHQPLKLYYNVWTRARLEATHEALLRLRGSSPYSQEHLERPGQDERVTTRIEVGAYLHVRSAALRAHATQVDPTEQFWFGLSDAELSQVYPFEDWHLARSLIGPAPRATLEDDLFTGVRERVRAR